MEATSQQTDDGRRQIFLQLIAQYQDALLRLAGVYAVTAQDREDIVQEIAIALWRAIPAFRRESSERTWLYRIAHNTAITTRGKLRRKTRNESSLEEVLEPLADSEEEDQRLIREQKRRWLLGAMRELPVLDRQILALHLEELTHSEIGEITGMSEGAIATRLSRIRARLTQEVRHLEVKSR
jgi:RNA polymerase sigma factor (sigma-70 family)